jgi:hypothetical protein
MKSSTRNWIVLAALAGFLSAAPAAFAQGYYGPRPAARADIRQDRRHLRRIDRHIVRDHRRLRIARHTFGPGSGPTRAARHHLRRDQRRYARQARDLHRDRRQLWARRSY